MNLVDVDLREVHLISNIEYLGQLDTNSKR